MKLTERQLKSIIKKVVAESFEDPENLSSVCNLSELKRRNPKAFQGYVDMFVEDCQDEFSFEDGKIVAYREDGTKLEFDPKSTSMDVGRGWKPSRW